MTEVGLGLFLIILWIFTHYSYYIKLPSAITTLVTAKVSNHTGKNIFSDVEQYEVTTDGKGSV